MADFKALQRQFAGHLRDPDRVPAPAGIQDRRMTVYRELAFNNVASLLAASFPVLRSLYPPAGWQALVRDWYRGHRARTPLFPALPGEFVAWLQQATGRQPWLAELAHYEWMELVAASAQADLDAIEHDPAGALIAGRPLLSPLVWPLHYDHAVHRIRAARQLARDGDGDGDGGQPGIDAGIGPVINPDAALASELRQVTCLLIVRDRCDQVGFLATNPLTLHLVEHLRQADGRRTGRAVLNALAAASGVEPRRMLVAGSDILAQLRERDIVLGTCTGGHGETATKP